MDGSQASSAPDVKRRRFSAADVHAMLEAGVLREREQVELVGGELVEMSPQGPLHWGLTQPLVSWVFRNLPENLTAASNGPLRLGEFDEPEPELFVFPAGIGVNDVRGPDVLLVVEVALSSLSYDLKMKAPLYAGHGIREYWVIDVDNRRTLIHRLAEGAYLEPEAVAFSAPLASPAGPLVIADLLPR